MQQIVRKCRIIYNFILQNIALQYAIQVKKNCTTLNLLRNKPLKQK